MAGRGDFSSITCDRRFSTEAVRHPRSRRITYHPPAISLRDSDGIRWNMGCDGQCGVRTTGSPDPCDAALPREGCARGGASGSAARRL
jgi:hypothetical protein